MTPDAKPPPPNRTQPTAFERGCGCLVTVFLGIFSLAFVMGAIMGDYMGPPEGAAEDSRNKSIRILLGFAGFIFFAILGGWIVTKRPPKGE